MYDKSVRVLDLIHPSSVQCEFSEVLLIYYKSWKFRKGIVFMFFNDLYLLQKFPSSHENGTLMTLIGEQY